MTIQSALLFLASVTFVWAAEAPPSSNVAQPDAPAAVRKTTAVKPTDACCQKELSATSFTKESIYQLDGRFTDDSGRPFSLSSFRGRPVVIDLFFASCGYACPLTVTDMLALQQRLPNDLRKKTAFVLISFDATRDTPKALAKYREERHLTDNWTLLHGDDDNVRELAALIGVQYRKTADGGFTHSSQITILNPEGEIVHERTGLQGGLEEAAAALAVNGK